jgi:hypothetical protein
MAPAYREQKPETVLTDLINALGGLAEALGDDGEGVVRQRRQRRSVQVRLVRHEFDLDIVPAVAKDGLDEALEIPDRDWSKWVKTHPLVYADRLSKLNKEHSDRIVPLIKLLKHWRDIHMTYRRPKSYWLECMVYHEVVAGNVITDGLSYAQIFRDLLDAIRSEYVSYVGEEGKVPIVKDPMLGNNVAHNWEAPAFLTFMNRLDESCLWADKALAAETTEEAVGQWQKVFGAEWFPDAVAVAREQGKSLREAGTAGALFVTSSGRMSLTPPVAELFVQPPAQRFFGDG